jgi:hypothetical protein
VRCAVCERTILAGERVRAYVSGDDRREVCELCVGRAEALGWRREGDPEAKTAASADHGRRGLRELLRRGLRRPGAPDPAPALPQEDPAAPGRRSRGPAPDPAAPHPFELAIARFNSSEAGRTVVGLTRTLGAPWVSVGASAGAPREARITVAWELSWYQWGVDLGDELRPVFQLEKGLEVAELDAAARQWNASLAEDGMVVLGTAAHRRPTAGAAGRGPAG